MKELKEKLEKLEKRFQKILTSFDRSELENKKRHLQALTLKSDFWADAFEAQKVMQDLDQIQTQLAQLVDLEDSLSTLKQLFQLGEKESENLSLDVEIEKLENDLSALETNLYLSGKFDFSNCLLSVHAGQGGVEAMDWAAMLLRMYTRFCEKKVWEITLIDENKGEEAGIKSATLEIKGQFAFGLLKRESGTHRLVRLSPFNADHLRQTSFALVEVLPVIERLDELEINEKDLEFETFRSSGPGGQNVQKVSTAVRVKHLPSGLTVTCQSERSQYQNKENALKILKSKLYQKAEQEKEKEAKLMKNWEKTASWGTQIRSYVLHPYQLVKDQRTGYEASNSQEILDGELEPFIEAEMKL